MATILNPIWRAWDWLTGRRTADLALLLLAFASVWSARNDIVAGNPPASVFGALVHGYIGWLIWRVKSREPLERDSETIPADAMFDRAGLLAMGGITLVAIFVLTPVQLLGDGLKWQREAVNWLIVVAELAAAVDYAGGGKSCLRRAADRLGEMAQSVTPLPAGVRA